MSSRRIERLSHIMREEISDLLQRGINDPRLARFISITRVDVSQDVKQAKVFVSVLGDDAEKKDAIRGFVAAGGFIRKELGRRIPIRSIPELSFALDESIASGERVLDIIKQVSEPGDGKPKT